VVEHCCSVAARQLVVDAAKARDVAWVNVEGLWAMRGVGFLADRYEAALASTVGMASRCLLTPTLPA